MSISSWKSLVTPSSGRLTPASVAASSKAWMIFICSSLGTVSLHCASGREERRLRRSGSGSSPNPARSMRSGRGSPAGRPAPSRSAGMCAVRSGRRWPAAPWRRPAGHALEAGDDAVEPVGVARERAREGVEVGDHAVQRLGVLRQASRRAAAARRARPATCFGRRRHRQRGAAAPPLAGRERQMSSVPPASAMTGEPVRPWKSIVDGGIGADRRVCGPRRSSPALAADRRDRARDPSPRRRGCR